MLESIKQPGDLRPLSGDQLTELAAEIRDFLVKAVAVRGGHLGPNLGVVELTIALHRALDRAGRPHRLGHRSPGVRAQAAHRPPGRLRQPAHPRRPLRLPVTGREPPRRDRELPRLDRPRLRPRPPPRRPARPPPPPPPPPAPPRPPRPPAAPATARAGWWRWSATARSPAGS